MSCLEDGRPDVRQCSLELAERLSLTEGPVKNYILTILAKSGVRDRTQAALLAVRRGLAP